MLASALVLGLLLIYGPQDVLSFNTITFSSVMQCGSFNVSFVGGQPPAALPLTLTILPLNSTNPLSIPIAHNAWDAKTSTGAAVTFLPITAGIMFIASLDDANGVGTGLVSDVIKIQPSDNSSCLPAGANTTTSAPPYTLNGTLSQCLPFNVSFNSTTADVPNIRAFSPRGPSFIINSTSESTESSGVVTFVMDDQRENEVVLLFDDGHHNRQTTDLITVLGDSSSSTECIMNQMQMGQASPQDAAARHHGLSKGTITGIVAGSITAVGVVSVLMALFVYVERRRRLGKVHRFTSLESRGRDRGAAGNVKAPQRRANLSPKPVSPRPSAAISVAPGPPSSSPRFIHGEMRFGKSDALPPSSELGIYRPDRGDERGSWIRRIPQRRFVVIEPALDLIPTPGLDEDSRELSSSPHLTNDQHELDIDEILEMATMYSLSPSTDIPTAQSFTPASTTSSRDHAPSDVPVGAEHMSMFYPLGSHVYATNPMQSVSIEEGGRHVSMGAFVGDTRNSTAQTASSSMDPIRPVEIVTATRVESAVAWVARMDL